MFSNMYEFVLTVKAVYVYDFVFEIQFLKKDHKKKETPIIVKNPFTKKYI